MRNMSWVQKPDMVAFSIVQSFPKGMIFQLDSVKIHSQKYDLLGFIKEKLKQECATCGSWASCTPGWL